MNERLRKLRRYLDLTQQEFGDRLGVKRNTIATYETGKSTPSDAAVSLICREFNVNEEWLRNGDGEMFIEIPEDDEIATLVYDLLQPDGNKFYEIILETMRGYQELSPNSQKVIEELCGNVLKNIKKKRGD